MNGLFFTVFFFLLLGLAVVWWKLRQAKRAEFIRDYMLPPGLFEKLRKKHPQLEIKDCQLVGHALRQFFVCYLKAQEKNVAMPSQVVDDLWHEFILYTRNYAQFCRNAFGGFLHHTPAAMLSSGPSNDQGLSRCWWQACREEDINPRKPTRLPLLFAIDRKLAIAGGYFYVLDCSSEAELAKVASLGGAIHCATTLAAIRPPRTDSGASSCSGSGCSSSSSSSSSSCSSGCSGSGCSGGCGGGGD
jgi:hypothetical protein